MEPLHFSALGFAETDIKKRLRLFELTEQDLPIADKLHKLVILPNLKRLVEEFYEFLFSHKEFRQFFTDKDNVTKLKDILSLYLSDIGKEFNSVEYFDTRLRVGVTHHRIGLPLILYQCAFQKIHQLIYYHIPHEVNDEMHSKLGLFLLKIVNLDISLAIDSYCLGDEKAHLKTINQMESKQTSLVKLALKDPLTQVANRIAILNQLKTEIKTHGPGKSFCIVMIDINDLGHINDVYGYFAGDLVIKEIVGKLSVLTNNSTLGRYGGDEFILLLKDTNLEQARKIMNDNDSCVKSTNIKLGDKDIVMSISQGVVEIQSNEKVESVLQRVFRDLTKAKMVSQASGFGE